MLYFIVEYLTSYWFNSFCCYLPNIYFIEHTKINCTSSLPSKNLQPYRGNMACILLKQSTLRDKALGGVHRRWMVFPSRRTAISDRLDFKIWIWLDKNVRIAQTKTELRKIRAWDGKKSIRVCDRVS